MEELVGEPPISTHSYADRFELEAHSPRTGVLVLQVRGELVAQTADAFRRRLAEALPSGTGRRVALDLSDVTAITPAGLDVLLDAQHRLAAAGGRLELLAPSPPVILLLHDAAAS
jgi:anti-anti-sigma factor